MKTTLRKTIAGLALGGGLLLGSAGVASATGTTTTDPNPPAAATAAPAKCERAEHVWERLVKLDQRLREQYRKLEAARDKAQAAGKTDLVAKIDKRLDTLKDRHAKIVERATELHDRIADRCTTAPDASAITSDLA